MVFLDLGALFHILCLLVGVEEVSLHGVVVARFLELDRGVVQLYLPFVVDACLVIQWIPALGGRESR